ncbi:MAG: T9SS type A sorting domain-containing protein [Bacteroidales bacterium]|nr:MAG: T9SS type A sorting domain-containing protein [Bacteroidales bacterium]
MKRISTFLLGLGILINVTAQQTFTNFQNASLVIGQPDFLTQWEDNTSDTITNGPSYSAISSKGMLAVAEQTGGSVKIWYKIPTQNGQPADVEVGNPDFFTENDGPTASFVRNFDGVAWSPDGNKLIAACGSQNRVLIWNSIPAINGQPADVVLGQPDFTSAGTGTSSTTMRYPCGVMVSPDGKLLVAEFYNHRVLVWNSIPTTNGAPADVVIGQADFNTNVSGSQANQLNSPWGVNYSPDGKLLIVNAYNHNVYIYDSIPESNGESATVVIGNDNFGLTTVRLSDSTMNIPVAATVTTDGKVAVAEFGNSRVLIFDSLPEAHGAHADYVLGQPDFYSSDIFAPIGNPDTNNLSRVYNVSTDLNGRLYVAGRDMDRVMVFGELPTDSADLGISIGESATGLCDSSDVVYSIKIENPGPDSAKNVVSTTAFPVGYSIESTNALDGTYNEVSGYWNIPFIEPDDSALLIINGIVDAGMAGQTITTYANIINSSAIDTNLNNNGTSVSVTISLISRPADPVASDTITCSGTSATLSATGEGTLYWYENPDDVIHLDTGAVYNTMPLTTVSTFYVEANNGCPSSNRTAVNVDLYPAYNLADTAIICSGDSYTFPDGGTQNNITATVIDTSYLITVDGCDSIIVTTVNVNPVYNIPETVVVCSGDSYTFPDGSTQNNITTTVIYSSNLTTMEGCDSIIETTVNVNPVYNTQETVAVCSGESYTFPDGSTQNNITTTVIYTSNLTTVDGCDSIIETTVNVNPVYDLEETVSVCSGDSYTFPDGSTQDNITSPVGYTSNLTTAGGCDSTILTNVDINTVDVSVTQDGIMLTANAAGAGYQWIDCDDGNNPVTGETSQTFTGTEIGNYAVIITENGCTDTSACYYISMEGIDENSLDNVLSVYPNPTTGTITIDLGRTYHNIMVDVINLQSLSILKQVFDYEHKSIELDLSEFESGIYIIKLITEDKTTLLRVFKE